MNLISSEIANLIREPIRTEEVDWIGHIPFASFLVEQLKPNQIVELGVYKGDSICAFANAVRELGFDCQTIGIDTWQGDVHMDYDGDVVYNELRDFLTGQRLEKVELRRGFFL